MAAETYYVFLSVETKVKASSIETARKNGMSKMDKIRKVLKKSGIEDVEVYMSGVER